MRPDATDSVKEWLQSGFQMRFRRNANGLALRYGAPVWLVGGALKDRKENDPEPRDYDVRIILTIPQMELLYGRCFTRSLIEHEGQRVIAFSRENLFDYDEWEWRRGYDGLKVSRIMSKRMLKPVDFQIQTDKEAASYKELPRVRLDTAPDWVFAASDSTC